MDRQTILKLEVKKFDYYDMGRFTMKAAKEVCAIIQYIWQILKYKWIGIFSKNVCSYNIF